MKTRYLIALLLLCCSLVATAANSSAPKNTSSLNSANKPNSNGSSKKAASSTQTKPEVPPNAQTQSVSTNDVDNVNATNVENPEPGITVNSNANKSGKISKNLGDRNDTPRSLTDWIIDGAAVLGGLFVLSLLAYLTLLLSNLRRTTEDYFSGTQKSIGGVKGKQDELSKQVEAFAGVNKEINQRLAELHTEVRQVSRMMQISQQGARESVRQASVPVAAGYAEPPAAKEDDMPSFPIAADDFLRKMQRKASVVKRDFQNDMLVSDPEGKGELVLIRDAKVPDEVQPLFVVPRVTQFQMRQEYYNFYEKYYECARPESGAVWIIDPAVVDKVAGGWQLREKGTLEVR